MQCPECGHTPVHGETEDPSRCPECGVYYHKGLSRKIRQAEVINQQQAEELKNAQAALSEKRAAPVMSYQVKEALGEYQGATPVVVLDLKMSFFSMVWFMVKWAIAAIPALIIVCIISVLALGFFGGVRHFLFGIV